MRNGGLQMAFLTSLLGYLAKFVLYAVLAACGIFAGKKLRDRKDAKTALENSDAKKNG